MLIIQYKSVHKLTTFVWKPLPKFKRIFFWVYMDMAKATWLVIPSRIYIIFGVVTG